MSDELREENLPQVVPSRPENDSIKKLEEFVEALDAASVSGSALKDLAKQLMEIRDASFPKFDKNGDLIAMIEDHPTRLKAIELLLKVLKILNTEPAAVFNGPVLIRWQD